MGPCLWLLFPLPGIPIPLNHQALFPLVLNLEISYQLPCLNLRVSSFPKRDRVGHSLLGSPASSVHTVALLPQTLLQMLMDESEPLSRPAVDLINSQFIW